MDLEEHVAEIVAAYLRKNHVAADQLAEAIIAVHEALTRLGQTPEPAAAPEPAVPVRRSVTPDRITCLECGQSGKMLRRHLSAVHHLTPDGYRAKWGLSHDYPMIAPNYAAQRSEFAKSIGLGRRGGGSPANETAQPDSPE